MVRQAVLANLDLYNSVVGGPTSTFLSGPRPTLLEVSPSEWHPRPLLRWRPRLTLPEVSPSAVAEVASSAVIRHLSQPTFYGGMAAEIGRCWGGVPGRHC